VAERAARGEKQKSGRKGETDPPSGENPFAVAALKLLLLTGCRKNEILSLQWQHVDFERACLRLPDSKTGAKVVHLGPPALEIFSKLERLEGNSHVFPSTSGTGHFVGLYKVWKRIREKAELPDVRIHDLRHSFASVGVASGDSLYIVGKLLGHTQARTTQRYAHLADDPIRAAADRISSQIADALDGQSTGEVVEISTARKG
jgi:integrase